jgi:hypothetical protein
MVSGIRSVTQQLRQQFYLRKAREWFGHVVFHANVLHAGQENSCARCSKLSGTVTIRGMCKHRLIKCLFACLVVFVNLLSGYLIYISRKVDIEHIPHTLEERSL